MPKPIAPHTLLNTLQHGGHGQHRRAKKKVSIDALQNTPAGQRLLAYVVKSGKMNSLKPFLPNGTIPKAAFMGHSKDMQGETVLHIALKHGKFDQIKDVLPEGESLTPDDMMLANRKHETLLVRAMKEEKIDLLTDAFGKDTPFEWRDFIKKDERNNSPLQEAIKHDYLPDLLSLMAPEAQPDYPRFAASLPQEQLYDKKGKTLDALPSLKDYSLKTLSLYKDGAPQSWLDEGGMAKLNKKRHRLSKRASMRLSMHMRRHTKDTRK